jgi:hypothetical protein
VGFQFRDEKQLEDFIYDATDDSYRYMEQELSTSASAFLAKATCSHIAKYPREQELQAPEPTPADPDPTLN